MYRFFIWKPEGKSPLGRNSHRYKDNNEMYLLKVGSGGMGSIELVMERDRCWALVNAL